MQPSFSSQELCCGTHDAFCIEFGLGRAICDWSGEETIL